MSWKAVLAVAVAAAATITIVIVVVTDSPDAKQTDGAFITEMVPHHESAVEMAELALERAEHPQTQRLARAIIQAQSNEIAQLEAIHERLFSEPVEDGDHGTLGLASHEGGMDTDMEALMDARQFDQAFIDMMIPHHQGAIRMARIQLDAGEDGELSALAESIIQAQSSEISQMNEWRVDWYGAPSPAGGIPPEASGDTPSHEAMGH
jgi:uncharacterized protein (DUF305 family)